MSLPVYTREAIEVAEAFAVDPQRGLAATEAVRRSIHFGRNVVHRARAWALAGTTRVLCDGEETMVRTADLVPGDVIVVDSGAGVPADARVVAADALIVDESELTGESIPVAKSPDAVADGAPLSQRRSMLYLGTHVVAGHATAIVTATGDATEIAKIARVA